MGTPPTLTRNVYAYCGVSYPGVKQEEIDQRILTTFCQSEALAGKGMMLYYIISPPPGNRRGL